MKNNFLNVFYLPLNFLSFILIMTRRIDLYLQGCFLGVSSGIMVTARFI